MSSANNSSNGSSPGGKRTRKFKGKSSQGCVTCKNRRVKCDETRPICDNCRRLGRVCVQRDGSSADPAAQVDGSLATDTSLENATTITRNTVDLAGVQEITNQDPSINASHQELQHQDSPNTRHVGQTLSPLNDLSDKLSSITIRNIMSSRKPTTAEHPNQVMEDSAQSTGQSCTTLTPGSEVSTMTNDMSDSSSTADKIKKIHKSATTKGSKEVVKDAPQSTTQPSTTLKSNLQVSPMPGATKNKAISSTKHAVIGSSEGLSNPNTQPTNTPLSGTPAPSAASNSSTPQVPPQRFTSTLSLASTTTNRPPGPSFKPLKPIHNWVPPRPDIIARTEFTDAEKEELRAEDAARKAEKKAEAERKEKEMEVLMGGANKCEEKKRAEELAERIRTWD